MQEPISKLILLLICCSMATVIQCQSSNISTTRSPTSAKLQDEGAKICTQRYAKFYANHTACVPPNYACKINKKGLSKQDQQIIINVHNHYRNLIASGNESRFGFGSASDMLAMEWDPELAYVAQKHADQCNFEHDCYDCRRTERYPIVGQNLYLYRTTRTTAETKWSYVIKEWYDEIEIAPPEVAVSFDLFNLNIGHFTQIAWSKTNKVGCGFTTFENNELDDDENSIFKTVQLYTCNYAPGGNFLGEKMYENGAAASQCPSKWSRSKRYSSLCEFSRPSKPKSTNNRKSNKKNKKKNKPKSKPRNSTRNNKRNRSTTVAKPIFTFAIPTRPTTTTSTSTTTTTPIPFSTTTQFPSTTTRTPIPFTTTTQVPFISTTSIPSTTTIVIPSTTTTTLAPSTTPATITIYSTTWWGLPRQTTSSRNSFNANNSNRIKTTRAPWWASYKTTRKPTWRYINNRHTTTPRISTTTRKSTTQSSFETNRIERRNVA